MRSIFWQPISPKRIRRFDGQCDMNTQAQYLKRLGVDLWLPRQPLDNAAASPAWVYSFTHPSEVSVETPEVPEAASAVLQSHGRSGVAHTLNELHAEQRSIAHINEALEVEAPTEASVVQETPLSPATAPAPQLVPRFRFALTRTPRFVIVDELPTQGAQILSDAYKRLLVGVVQALGENPKEMSLPLMVHWPHLAGSKVNQGAQEAYKYVQLTLGSLQRKSTPETLLMFGAGLGRWVLGEQFVTLNSGELILHPVSNVSCLATASLSQALQLPDIKRQIWQDLQPVVRG